LVEYARSVLGITNAEHEESSPEAPELLISNLACSLVGKTEDIDNAKGSLAEKAYKKPQAAEQFRCSFGLNPSYRAAFDASSLKAAGTVPKGEMRIAELTTHPFFMSNLFLPQLSSSPETPHPIIVAFLKAAQTFHEAKLETEKQEAV